MTAFAEEVLFRKTELLCWRAKASSLLLSLSLGSTSYQRWVHGHADEDSSGGNAVNLLGWTSYLGKVQRWPLNDVHWKGWLSQHRITLKAFQFSDLLRFGYRILWGGLGLGFSKRWGLRAKWRWVVRRFSGNIYTYLTILTDNWSRK